MLQRVTRTKDACVDRLGKNFNHIQLEQLFREESTTIQHQSTYLVPNGCNDDYMFDELMSE
jgi:hypothetical protein